MNYKRALLLALLFASAVATLAAAQGSSSSSDSTSNSTSGAGEEEEKKKKEFPLVWLCLPISVVGVIIVFVVAQLRPNELVMPGMTVMTAQERDDGGLDMYGETFSNKKPGPSRGSSSGEQGLYN